MDALDRLKEAITRQAGEGVTRTALPGVSVVRSPTPTGPVGVMVEPTLAVVAQGVKKTALNGRTFTYGAGQFLVVSVELPLVGHIAQASADEPLLAFVLELRAEKIAALLLETAPAATTRAGAVDSTPAGIAVSDASPALLDAIGRLLALLDAPEDAAALAAGVEREILWRLVTGPQGAAVRQIGLADSRLAHLARVIHWIRGHFDETLRVEELAALATMSVSSFHRHFRAVTAMTPIQFQKQIRLHEARARLLAEPGDVAGIGFAVGYDSPAQFSREYRRMFGVPPSRDAPALREAAVLPASVRITRPISVSGRGTLTPSMSIPVRPPVSGWRPPACGRCPQARAGGARRAVGRPRCRPCGRAGWSRSRPSGWPAAGRAGRRPRGCRRAGRRGGWRCCRRGRWCRGCRS
jgi:AraC-like DNA-binding protein